MYVAQDRILYISAYILAGNLGLCCRMQGVYTSVDRVIRVPTHGGQWHSYGSLQSQVILEKKLWRYAYSVSSNYTDWIRVRYRSTVHWSGGRKCRSQLTGALCKFQYGTQVPYFSNIIYIYLFYLRTVNYILH